MKAKTFNVRTFPRILPLLCLCVLCRDATANAIDRPNIVVILADDFGYGSVGCYGADPRLIQTPAIDRLAREGRRFTDASTPSSVCMPTRYALLTGRYCWRSRLNHGEVLNTLDPLLIEPNRPTIASMLKKHGYRTGFVGKWHLGYGTDKRVDYTRRYPSFSENPCQRLTRLCPTATTFCRRYWPHRMKGLCVRT